MSEYDQPPCGTGELAGDRAAEIVGGTAPEPYDRGMASAADVAAAIRDRIPGVPAKKLHKLLYYCQGHHLANFGRPLFDESVSAWDMGPVVGRLWYDEKDRPTEGAASELDEGQLNTIGFVISRYGALTGRDLENLTHAEEPWRRADTIREPGGSVRIESEWIQEFFSRSDPDEVSELDLIGSAPLRSWLAEGATRVRHEPKPDDVEELRRRIA